MLGSDNKDILDGEMRSLSLNELNNKEDIAVQGHEQQSESSNEGNKPIYVISFLGSCYCFPFFAKKDSESSEETEDRYHLSNDLWENDVLTDPDYSNDLQKSIGTVMNKCRSVVKMINKSANLTGYVDRLKVAHKVRHHLSIDCTSR